MKSVLVRFGVAGFIVVAMGLVGCSSGGSGGSGDADTDVVPTFVQPKAGIVVSAGASAGGAQIDYVLSGETSATTVPVSATALASDSALASSVSAVSPASVHPFKLLTVTGSGFRVADSAISVIFRASGMEPMVVPAIAATATSVEVAVPALIDGSGANVAAHATVQVFQIGQWGFSVTDVYDGVDIGALPQVNAAIPAGSVVNAWLASALTQIAAFEAAGPGDKPASFWTALANLKADLTTVQTAVQQVMADPTATPALPGTGGAGTVVLDASSLALADRLVAALLLRLGEGLGMTTTGTLPTGAMLVGVVAACPPNTTEKWLDDFNCSRQQYGLDLAALGRKLVALGAKIEASIYLGIFGGVSTTAVGQVGGPGAATAYELVMAGANGHLAAWSTANEPPAAGETLADVGVTILDKLAGTQGLLSALYSAVSLGKETDAIIQAQSDTGGTGVLEGVVAGTATETSSGCQWQHSLSVTVTVTGFGGSGTLIDPWVGDVSLTGNDIATLVSGGYCDAGGTIPLSATGWVDGTSSEVDIIATGYGGTGTFTFAMPSGSWDGSSLSGAWQITSDAFDQPITGTVVLSP